VPDTLGSAAACAMDMPFGTAKSWWQGTKTRSEYAPKKVMPTTVSPSCTLAPGPTRSTTPARSKPGQMG